MNIENVQSRPGLSEIQSPAHQSEAFRNSSPSVDVISLKNRDHSSSLNRPGLGRINSPSDALCNGPKRESCAELPEIFGQLDFSEKHNSSSSISCGLGLLAAGHEIKRPSSALEASERPNSRTTVNGIERHEIEKFVNVRAFSDEDPSPVGGQSIGGVQESNANSECSRKTEDDLRNVFKPKKSIDSIFDLVAGVGRGSNNLFVPQNSGFGSQKMMNSPKYSESLQLCTEGLGFESSDERDADSVSVGSDSTASSPRFPPKPGVEWDKFNSDEGRSRIDRESQKQLENDGNNNNNIVSGEAGISNGKFLDCHEIFNGGKQQHCNTTGGTKRGRSINKFPPPLPSIAGNGHSTVFLKPFRKDGRFLLEEVKAPPHEFLHAWRGDGRLKLKLVHQEEDLATRDNHQSTVADGKCDHEKEVSSYDEECVEN
eukprot:Gb_27761 [translate_table: standard]